MFKNPKWGGGEEPKGNIMEIQYKFSFYVALLFWYIECILCRIAKASEGQVECKNVFFFKVMFI